MCVYITLYVEYRYRWYIDIDTDMHQGIGIDIDVDKDMCCQDSIPMNSFQSRLYVLPQLPNL